LVTLFPGVYFGINKTLNLSIILEKSLILYSGDGVHHEPPYKADNSYYKANGVIYENRRISNHPHPNSGALFFPFPFNLS